MNWIQRWVLPPLIGAIIGYFTNWLAIKMLFRPYKAIKVLGFKLPFTPGILPRERERLAQSLGDTVAQELLTPQVIKKRIQSQEIRATAEGAIRIALGGFLGQSAEQLFSSSDETVAVEATVKTESSADLYQSGRRAASISKQILQSFQQLAGSAELQSSMRSILSEFLHRVGDMELGKLITKAQFARSIVSAADTLATRSAQSSEVRNQGAHSAPFFDVAIDLPPDVTVRALADAFIPKAYEIALPHIGAFMRGDEFKSRLETEARAFVKRALGRLGPLQRLFVSIAGYDAKIAQTMPDTIEDLIDTIETILRDPIAPEKVSEAICTVVIERRAKSGVAGTSTDREEGRAFVDSSLLGVLHSLSGARDELRERAERAYDRLAGVKLHELATLPVTADDAAGLVLNAFVRTISHGSQAVTTMGALFVDVLMEAARGISIAEFFGSDEKDIDQLSETLSTALLSLIESRMPLLVEAIDIRAMVAERIDSLDMQEVERIVLQVVNKELLWITWLGGILGALIGALQSLISTF